MERKWMVLRLDTDGVVIVYSHENEKIAEECHFLIFGSNNDYAIKYGYPWEV